MTDTKTDLMVDPQNVFEIHKKMDPNGQEYWSARDLSKILQYSEFRHFQPVIDKAKLACLNSGHKNENHFVDSEEDVAIGSGATKVMPAIFLSRYACYLIVQNSDPTKIIVAKGQTYFAIQTRRQEKTDNLIEDSSRIFLRKEIKKHNVSLMKTASMAGVESFAIFQNAGYKGLYGGV